MPLMMVREGLHTEPQLWIGEQVSAAVGSLAMASGHHTRIHRTSVGPRRTNKGWSAAQASIRIGQRVTNGQPGGGSLGSGSSPPRLTAVVRRLGSGLGMAESSAFV